MIRLSAFSLGSGLVAVMMAVCSVFVVAQTPAPPLPKLTKEQKESAAAIEAPKTLTPPPLPGQLESKPITKPAAPTPVPAVVPAPPAAPASDSSSSKMKVLEAVTQRSESTPAPHVPSPSDKIPITSSTSTSRQFIVHGTVFKTRSAMATRCEEISQSLRKVLHDSEPWVLPIIVLLNTGDDAVKSKGAPISTAITEITHGGFHLQVTVNERPGLSAAELQKEVVRALLAERILRNHQKINPPEGRLLLPDWVMTGVLHAMDYRAAVRPSALFATIFRSGKIYGIEEIIEASPVEMDGLSRTIYETSCCALVLALVDQPEGAKRFNRFLNALASDPRSERDLLSAAFPNFAASASSLNKWWSLQLATLSKPGVAEPLTAAESLKAIADAISLRYEASPDEVPKNVKMRPFVIPASLAVAPAPKLEPTPVAEEGDAPPKPKAKEVAAAKDPKSNKDEESAEPETESSKRSLWRRLLFLGPAKEDAPSSDAKEEQKPEAAKVAEEPPETGTEEKRGMFSRLFGGDSKSEPKEEPVTANPVTAEPEAVATEKPKAEKKEAPKIEKKEEAEPEKEKKPSILNPLNWFRGGKKTSEEPSTEDAPAKDGQAVLTPPAALDWARLVSPSLADAWGMIAPGAPQQTVEPLFNFLRRKKKPEESESKEEPVKKEEDESKKATAKPAAESKKESKPKTTNPNAKPASKPATPGTPRITNPSAKPLPPGFVPPTASGAAAPVPAKSGLVPVVLPLEEYQQVLKRPDHAAIFQRSASDLIALQTRVGVLFRPVVDGYLAVVLDLHQGKTKDVDKRLAALHEFALIAYQKSIAVRDYLDWFEASETDRLSGKFDDFLNLPKIIDQELPPRTDPISQYLDAIDKEFTK